MIKLALIGRNIKHSKSQQTYEKLLNQKIEYSLIDCDTESNIPSLEELFKEHDGVSITAPYKPYFLSRTENDVNCRKIGGVNCIVNKSGKYHSYNTDYLAVQKLVTKFKFKNAIILGDGVTSRMTQMILKEKSIPFRVLSRKNGLLEKELDLRDEVENTYIINSTSREYIFNGEISKEHTFWDFNYSMIEHQQKFKGQYIDGEELLKEQASFALSLWKIS